MAIKLLENDIEDKNFIRYIVRFLKSEIMEKEFIKESLKGASHSCTGQCVFTR